MDFKPKNREWVKNAVIIFLAVMLFLTFFSNTIMNRSLPETATQMVTDGSIVAQVRGTGTVTANGSHQVKAEETREIRAVMIKAGQEISAGDVLFILGEGDSEELEAAQDQLRQLQISYQKTALNMPTFDYSSDERKIASAKTAMDEAQAKMNSAMGPGGDIEAARAELAKAEETLRQAEAAFENRRQAAVDRVNKAQAELDRLLGELQTMSLSASADFPEPQAQTTAQPQTTEQPQTTAQPQPTESPVETPDVTDPPKSEIDLAREELAAAQAELEKLNNTADPLVEAAKSIRDQRQQELDNLLYGNTAYQEAKAAYTAAAENYYSLSEALAEKKEADNKSQQLAAIDLADIATQMQKYKDKIKDLSGGEENQITANVSGTIQTVDCTAGDTKAKDEVLCTIEVPDMGYSLSFSVTNDQARKLRPGDTATVSNYYWGREILATLSTISVDPKNPQNNKLLNFDLEGDVTAGAELTISVGQKSAGYDIIVPNSSIRSDTNGSFVLKIEAKSSPLGNRYIARRVDVEVLASDDKNSAVTGDLSYGDYVITTSNLPVKNGDMVKMPDT